MEKGTEKARRKTVLSCTVKSPWKESKTPIEKGGPEGGNQVGRGIRTDPLDKEEKEKGNQC